MSFICIFYVVYVLYVCCMYGNDVINLLYSSVCTVCMQVRKYMHVRLYCMYFYIQAYYVRVLLCTVHIHSDLIIFNA